MLFKWWRSWIVNRSHNVINNISFAACISKQTWRSKKRDKPNEWTWYFIICVAVFSACTALILNGLERNHVTYDVTHCVLHSKYLSLIHRANACDDIGCGAVAWRVLVRKKFQTFRFKYHATQLQLMSSNTVILIESRAFYWRDSFIYTTCSVLHCDERVRCT